jgi:hypothetical protein
MDWHIVSSTIVLACCLVSTIRAALLNIACLIKLKATMTAGKDASVQFSFLTPCLFWTLYALLQGWVH